jgi:hypothetical protein
VNDAAAARGGEHQGGGKGRRNTDRYGPRGSHVAPQPIAYTSPPNSAAAFQGRDDAHADWLHGLGEVASRA